MPAYVFTTSEGDHYRHTEKPYSVTLLDDAFQPVSARFVADEEFDCGHSLATNRFVMGFWRKPDHLGVGQYSGDGSLFGGFVSGRSTNYTIVLDAHTGQQTGRLRTIAADCLPFRGTCVRDQATRNNSLRVETLDLATGARGKTSLDGKPI